MVKALGWWRRLVGAPGATLAESGATSERGVRADAPRSRVRRGAAAGVPFVSVTLEFPARTYSRVARGLAGSAAEVCACHRGFVGSVTLVPGEEPALVALAPQRDAIANRLLAVLMAGESHRAPHLLLLLQPGVYLAQVVDPYAPLQGTLEEVAGMLAGGRVVLAARLSVCPQRGAVAVKLALLASDPHTLRAALAEARAAAASRLR